jgi:hypothetical protein
MKTLNDFLSESILDPIKSQLSSDLWTKENKLKPSIKTLIIKRLENWLKTKINKKIKHMFILGSIAGYQYNNSSDIDVNFVIDVNDERLKEIAESMMAELNEKKLPGTGHPINYFVSNKIEPAWKNADNVYDVLNNKWIVKPSVQKQETVITNYRAVIEIARFFMSGLNSIISEYKADVANYEIYIDYLKNIKDEKDRKELERLSDFKLHEIISDIDSVKIAKHLIKGFRKEAFKEEEGAFEISTKIEVFDNANNSINNLIYKYLEKLGYFEETKKILDEEEKWNKLL